MTQSKMSAVTSARRPGLVCKTQSGTNFVRHTHMTKKSLWASTNRGETVGPTDGRQSFVMFVFQAIIVKEKKKKLSYEIAWHMQRSSTYGHPMETKAVGVMD